MVGGLRGMAAVLGLAAVATGPSVGGSSSPARAPVSEFGGPVAVHIAHVGRIEVDLESDSTVGLRRVPCAATPADECFVAH